MPTTSLGKRLAIAMQAADIGKPADLARAAETTTASISNWLNDNVDPDHVKAVQLFKIADAVGTDPRELLLGAPSQTFIREDRMPYTHVSAPESQPVKMEEWTLAFQLVAEALDERGLTLPPAKRAEVTLLAYELLLDGLQQAKVLRFVQAAAA